MKPIFFSLLMLSALNTFAQSDYTVSKDKETGQTIYQGQVTFNDLQKSTDFSWFTTGSASYKPDTVAIQYLKKTLKNYEIIVFMGTWCDDSHMWIPKFYKVLQMANYPFNSIMMYGVDRGKNTKNGYENKLYNLDKVPTIILTRNKVEIGRIVETPHKTIEIDLVQMIQKNLDAQ